MKKIFRTIHLYLGLAAGLIIMMSCITGTVLVFEEELGHLFNSKRYFVEPATARLPLATLIQNAKESVSEAKIASVKVYTAANRTVEVGLIVPQQAKGEGAEKKRDNETGNKKPDAGRDEKAGMRRTEGKGGERPNARPNLSVFVNPYTGAVTGSYSKGKSFFHTVEMLHRFLLGGNGSVGKHMVGISSFCFLFITVTGIILWWPKTKKILLQRLKYKWNGSFKRLNHDLHVVSGFYTSIFLLIIIISGLMMAYSWMGNSVYVLTGTKPVEIKPVSSMWKEGLKPVSADAVFNLASRQETGEYYTIRTPQDSAGAYSVTVLPEGSLEPAINMYTYDQYTAAVIAVQKFKDKNLGQKIRAYVKPVHTGALYGLPTKILSLVICLLTMTFPVTGVMMWLNRTRVKRRVALPQNRAVVYG